QCHAIRRRNDRHVSHGTGDGNIFCCMMRSTIESHRDSRMSPNQTYVQIWVSNCCPDILSCEDSKERCISRNERHFHSRSHAGCCSHHVLLCKTEIEEPVRISFSKRP